MKKFVEVVTSNKDNIVKGLIGVAVVATAFVVATMVNKEVPMIELAPSEEVDELEELIKMEAQESIEEK